MEGPRGTALSQQTACGFRPPRHVSDGEKQASSRSYLGPAKRGGSAIVLAIRRALYFKPRRRALCKVFAGSTADAGIDRHLCADPPFGVDSTATPDHPMIQRSGADALRRRRLDPDAAARPVVSLIRALAGCAIRTAARIVTSSDMQEKLNDTLGAIAPVITAIMTRSVATFRSNCFDQHKSRASAADAACDRTVASELPRDMTNTFRQVAISRIRRDSLHRPRSVEGNSIKPLLPGWGQERGEVAGDRRLPEATMLRSPARPLRPPPPPMPVSSRSRLSVRTSRLDTPVISTERIISSSTSREKSHI